MTETAVEEVHIIMAEDIEPKGYTSDEDENEKTDAETTVETETDKKEEE